MEFIIRRVEKTKEEIEQDLKRMREQGIYKIATEKTHCVSCGMIGRH